MRIINIFFEPFHVYDIYLYCPLGPYSNKLATNYNHVFQPGHLVKYQLLKQLLVLTMILNLIICFTNSAQLKTPPVRLAMVWIVGVGGGAVGVVLVVEIGLNNCRTKSMPVITLTP